MEGNFTKFSTNGIKNFISIIRLSTGDIETVINDFDIEKLEDTTDKKKCIVVIVNVKRITESVILELIGMFPEKCDVLVLYNTQYLGEKVMYLTDGEHGGYTLRKVISDALLQDHFKIGYIYSHDSKKVNDTLINALSNEKICIQNREMVTKEDTTIQEELYQYLFPERKKVIVINLDDVVYEFRYIKGEFVCLQVELDPDREEKRMTILKFGREEYIDFVKKLLNYPRATLYKGAKTWETIHR